MLMSCTSSSQCCTPAASYLLIDLGLVTVSSNFLTDLYLHVTSRMSVSTSSRNRFSTSGRTHSDGRPEMLLSCPSVSNELVEKVALSALERQNAYFKMHMPTSDFSEGQGTAFVGVRGCLHTLIINYCITENAHHAAV